MTKVIIMQGVPGSGKSSYVKSLVGVTMVCSADHYFEGEGGVYRFDPSKLAEAHGACLRQFVWFVMGGADGDTVVVDNTNTTALEIAPYMAIAAAYGCEVEIVRMTCDPEVAWARNIHGVSRNKVRRMAESIDGFVAPEFWVFKRVFTSL